MTYQERKNLFERLRASLLVAQTERKTRPAYGPGNWNAFEIQTMHESVNMERARLGKADLDLAAIIRAETGASGHSDYSSKWIHYCVELVEAK